MVCVPYVKPVNQVTFLCHLITTSAVTDCSYDQSEAISLSADASCRLPNIVNLISSKFLPEKYLW